MSAAKRFKRDVPVQISEETLVEVNKFKKSLNEFDENLVKLEYSFNRPKDYIFDECAEFRRLIQLETEETIGDIKMKNNLDIDTDESELSPGLIFLINGLNKQSDSMIAEVDKYEKEALVLFETKETDKKHLKKDINKSKTTSKYFVSHWKTCLTEMDFEENKMRDAVRKLNEYQIKLNETVRKVNLFIFSNNLLQLKPYSVKQEFHLSSKIFFDQTRHFVKSQVFDFQSIIKLSKLEHPERENQMNFLGKLDDDTCLIEFNSILHFKLNLFCIYYKLCSLILK